MPGPATDRILDKHPELQDVGIPERIKTLCRWIRDLKAPPHPPERAPANPARPAKLRVTHKPRTAPPAPSTQSKLPLDGR